MGYKIVNIVTARSIDGCGNLFIILSVFQSSCWWNDTVATVHLFVDVSVLTSSQFARDSSFLIGNGSHASVHDIVMLDLKFTSRKIVQLRNVQ